VSSAIATSSELTPGVQRKESDLTKRSALGPSKLTATRAATPRQIALARDDPNFVVSESNIASFRVLRFGHNLITHPSVAYTMRLSAKKVGVQPTIL
jgi:hypothetical protein